MPTLAIDTATPAPSLALCGDDGVIERTLIAEPGAGRRVAEEIHRLLQEAGAGPADLTDIVVGVGPGGFTGLRIGIATALGLGQALGIPVTGVASIEALGLGLLAPAGGVVVPVIDAKRGEVFAAAYAADGDVALRELTPPVAIRPDDLAPLLAQLVAAHGPVTIGGDGTVLCSHLAGPDVALLPADAPAHRISAALLARRARQGGARPVTPLYLRLPDAEVNRRRREAGDPQA